MSIQLAFWLIGGAGFLGYVIGRFVFLMKNGQMITTVVKQRTVFAENFKAGSVFKAMASQFKKDGFVIGKNVVDRKRFLKELAKAMNVVPEALEVEERPNSQLKITLKEKNNG